MHALLMHCTYMHDSRDCPETAVSSLHQKRLGGRKMRSLMTDD